MIKHVLVHVDKTTAGETCLNYAIALARHLDARLTGIHITPPAEVAPIYKPSRIERTLQRIEARARDSAEAAAAFFRRSIGGTDLECEWHGLSGDMADGISKAARFADLTVLSQSRQPGPALRHLTLAEVTLMKCAGPVLIVPNEARPVVPARAILFWDGRRETARALHHAIPLIQGCGASIDVVCCAGAHIAELGPLVDHLTRHGVTVFRSDQKPDPAGAVSRMEQWQVGGFDLVIMGAFGRAPWQEVLFGGPTLTATRTTKLTLLACH